MNQRRYISLGFSFLLLVFLRADLLAQNVLSLEDAIKTGLEKNYSVNVLKNQKEIAKLQNNIGNAGMSPQISVNGILYMSYLNSNLEFATGATQQRKNAQTLGYEGSVNLDMKVYDGNKMFAIKRRLSQNEQLSAIQLRQQMENTIYNIILAYFDVVRVAEMIKTEQQNLLIYAERVKIAKLKLEIGSDSKVDLLMSQRDENKAKSLITQMEFQLLDAKIKLNNEIGFASDADYFLKDSIVLNYQPGREDLKKDIGKKNAMIQIAKQNESIAGQNILEARSNLLPFVNLGVNYRYLKTQSQAGVLLANNQNGIYGEFRAGWVLFSGNKNSRLLQEKNINLLNQKLITSQIELEVNALVYVNYQKYLLSQKIAELERRNLNDSKELQIITLERYRVGKTNLLETIEAQKNLEDAQYRYINAMYSAKMAETELLRVNGDLVK